MQRHAGFDGTLGSALSILELFSAARRAHRELKRQCRARKRAMSLKDLDKWRKHRRGGQQSLLQLSSGGSSEAIPSADQTSQLCQPTT